MNKLSRQMLLHRRDFLKLAGSSVAAGFFLSGRGFNTNVFAQQTGAQLSKFTEQVPIPSVIDLTGGGSFNLAMEGSTHQFHASLPAAPTFGYGGASYLGPTFNVRRGKSISITASNDLGSHPLDFAIDDTLNGALDGDRTAPRVSLHLHGGNTEAKSDGHPLDTFHVGAAKTYYYDNDQEASTLWYHDHAMGITRLNVMAGLAGFYLMRDERDTGLADNPIGLPSGQYEIPLVIQDRMFAADGSMAYPAGPLQTWSPEFFGDVPVVNGKAFPNLNLRRGLYRFRLLNGSNARVYVLYLSNGATIYQIGGDGGLLNAPVPLKQLTLAPGERADVLIDFTKVPRGTRVVLKNNAPAPFPNGPRSPQLGGVMIPDIMQFTVTASGGFSGKVPSVLRNTPIQRLGQPVRVRNLSLVEIMDPATGNPLMARLNNLMFDTENIERPKVDTVEQWNIINTTGDMHPIHLHLVQFQVLSRQKFRVDKYAKINYSMLDMDSEGPYPVPSADKFAMGGARPPDANEMGWKDTVRANPGEITRIMVPFGANVGSAVPFGKSFTGDYVWHCHILEHEDNEMMLPYEVVA